MYQIYNLSAKNIVVVLWHALESPYFTFTAQYTSDGPMKSPFSSMAVSHPAIPSLLEHAAIAVSELVSSTDKVYRLLGCPETITYSTKAIKMAQDTSVIVL